MACSLRPRRKMFFVPLCTHPTYVVTHDINVATTDTVSKSIKYADTRATMRSKFRSCCWYFAINLIFVSSKICMMSGIFGKVIFFIRYFITQTCCFLEVDTSSYSFLFKAFERNFLGTISQVQNSKDEFQAEVWKAKSLRIRLFSAD